MHVSQRPFLVSITLKSGGTIELTDTANLDVAHTDIFKFATSSNDGKIYVSGAGTLKGQNLTVSKALTDAGALEVAAKSLTLGSADFEGKAALVLATSGLRTLPL